MSDINFSSRGLDVFLLGVHQGIIRLDDYGGGYSFFPTPYTFFDAGFLLEISKKLQELNSDESS